MTSREQIYNELANIAQNHNLRGDAVEMQMQWLATLFHHLEVEVTNAYMESNLATATMLNSKITQCMSVMYSVYRGKNPRLLLSTFNSNTILKKDKFELVYQSNNFYIYTTNAISLTNGDYSLESPIEFLITKKPKYETEITVSESGLYYVDIIKGYKYLNNLSEDIRVRLNDKEVPTTRLFFKHMNQPTRDVQRDPLSPFEDNDLDIDASTNLFVLTIPDYGVRLYKKGGFSIGDKIVFEGFDFVSKLELENEYPTEITKIKFKGFDMDVYINESDYQRSTVYDPSTGEYVVDDDTIVNYIKEDISRDTVKSLLYNSTAFNRVQSQIMSNTDTNVLFTEYFKDFVKSSTYSLIGDEETTNNSKLVIYYIPQIYGVTIPSVELDEFKAQYASYFITPNFKMIANSAIQNTVTLNIKLNVSKTVDLSDAIKDILGEYEYQIPKLNRFDELDGRVVVTDVTSNINWELIKAKITKLDNVNYISDISLSSDLFDDITINNFNDKCIYNGIPTYLIFKLNLTYELS